METIQPLTQESPTKPSKTLGILSLIFGSVGLLTSILLGLGLFPAIAGLILGIFSIIREKKKVLSIIAVSISTIAAILSLLMLIVAIAKVSKILTEETADQPTPDQTILYTNSTKEENLYLNEVTALHDGITEDLGSFLRQFNSGVIEKETLLSAAETLCNDLIALEAPLKYTEAQEKNIEYADSVKEGIALIKQGFKENDTTIINQGTLKIDHANNVTKKEVIALINKILDGKDNK